MYIDMETLCEAFFQNFLLYFVEQEQQRQKTMKNMVFIPEVQVIIDWTTIDYMFKN